MNRAGWGGRGLCEVHPDRMWNPVDPLLDHGRQLSNPCCRHADAQHVSGVGVRRRVPDGVGRVVEGSVPRLEQRLLPWVDVLVGREEIGEAVADSGNDAR